jgi:hypothetical protein
VNRAASITEADEYVVFHTVLAFKFAFKFVYSPRGKMATLISTSEDIRILALENARGDG